MTIKRISSDERKKTTCMTQTLMLKTTLDRFLSAKNNNYVILPMDTNTNENKTNRVYQLLQNANRLQ